MREVRTFSEEHMGSPVHDAIADREVIDDSVHGLLRRRDEVDAVHRAQGLSLLVDIFHHCEKNTQNTANKHELYSKKKKNTAKSRIS